MSKEKNCPYCGKTMCKSGFTNAGTQIWQCKNCNRRTTGHLNGWEFFFNTFKNIRAFYEYEMSINEISKYTGASKSSVYRAINAPPEKAKEYRKKDNEPKKLLKKNAKAKFSHFYYSINNPILIQFSDYGKFVIVIDPSGKNNIRIYEKVKSNEPLNIEQKINLRMNDY